MRDCCTAARGGICPCRHCRRQCKIFASGVNFSIFTHFLCFFLLKLLKLGEIDGVKFLAWKSGGVKFWTNSMSALTGCLDIFTLSANVRISKWLLLGFLVGIFPGFLSPWFALGHTSRSLLGWLGLCSRRAIGHSWSHTKHHHHNYHDHNRKDGNDNHRHYYYHHHPGDLVQTILIGPLGCESWFLEWVNWEYFSNIGKGANQQHHSQTKLIIVLLWFQQGLNS